MRIYLTKLLFAIWPFSFAHVRIMNTLNPPSVDEVRHTRKIRGFSQLISFDPNSYIGKYLYYRGVFEEPIARKIASSLKTGMTFIDVGANIGQHTLIASGAIGPSGRIVSFEPQEKVRELLKENINNNNLNNITVLPYALGQHDGSANIYHMNKKNDGEASLRPGSFKESVTKEKITIRTLSGLMSELNITHIDVMKIDIEGAELDMLKGSEAFFNRCKPKKIFIECVEKHLERFDTSSLALTSWLIDQGYTLYQLEQWRWKEIKASPDLNSDLLAVIQN